MTQTPETKNKGGSGYKEWLDDDGVGISDAMGREQNGHSSLAPEYVYADQDYEEGDGQTGLCGERRMTTLYHARSEELNGFYQSDILVAATNTEDAINLALNAYEKWIREYWEELGFTPSHQSRPCIYEDEGEDFETELKIRLNLMRTELDRRLKPIANNAIIMHRS